MATATSPDNIPIPTSGDQVSPLETTFANQATALQTALSSLRTLIGNQGNYFRGTNAQMTAQLDTIPRGAYWFNTTNNKTYRRGASAWVVWDEPSATNVTPGAAVDLHATYPLNTRIVGGNVYLSGMVQAKTGTIPYHSSVATFAAPYLNPRQCQVAIIWDPLGGCYAGGARIFGSAVAPKSGTVAAVIEINAVWPVNADL